MDLEAGRLQVRQTVDTTSGRTIFREPKPRGSQRAITLTTLAITALETHRKKQAVERIAAGDRWSSYDLVFTTRNGTPILVSNLVRKVYKPLLRAAGLPDVRFYDLRHSVALALLAANVHLK